MDFVDSVLLHTLFQNIKVNHCLDKSVHILHIHWHMTKDYDTVHKVGKKITAQWMLQTMLPL